MKNGPTPPASAGKMGKRKPAVKLTAPWARTTMSRPPPVPLYTQVKSTERATTQNKKEAKGKSAWLVPAMKNNGRCHRAHNTPRTRLAVSAFIPS
jgi:hypothetical protein